MVSLLRWLQCFTSDALLPGLVYPGLGWLVFRDAAMLPESLVFRTAYLGSEQISFQMNFSKSASTVVCQYYQFLRLGRAGYTRIFQNLKAVAQRLAAGVLATGAFRLLSDDVSLPLVAFSFLPRTDGSTRGYDEFALSDKLRERGWVLPAYRLAPKADHITLMRAVVREDLSASMCDQLVRDIGKAVAWLEHFHAAAKADAAPAAAEAAPCSLAEDWNAKHAPHRLRHKGVKKHAGVC